MSGLPEPTPVLCRDCPSRVGVGTRVAARRAARATASAGRCRRVGLPPVQSGRARATARIPRRPPAVWTPEEVARFLTGAKDDRFFALYLLAATTGMRRAELCGLRWAAVDLDRGTLSVTTTRVVVRGRAQDSDDTKSERGQRLLSVDPVTVDGLADLRKRQDEERSAFGSAYRETDLAFTWEDGRPVHPDVIRQRFNRLVTRLKLPAIRLHDLRHSYATVALRAGINPKIVSERLGHASVAFTLTQYSHVLPGIDRDAAQTMADLMLGRTSVPNSVPARDQKATRAPDPEIGRPGRRGSGGRI